MEAASSSEILHLPTKLHIATSQMTVICTELQWAPVVIYWFSFSCTDDSTKRDAGNSGVKCRPTKPKLYASVKETTTMLVFQFLKIYYLPCISVVTTAGHKSEKVYYFASSVSNQFKFITVHDRPLYLAHPGRTSCGIHVGFIRSTHSLHQVYVFIWDARSELVHLNNNHVLTKGKPTVNSFPNL